MTPEDQIAALAELRESARLLSDAILRGTLEEPKFWEQLVEAWCNISDSET